MAEDISFHEIGRSVFQAEIAGLQQMGKKLNDSFDHVCKILLACQGRIIVMGVGKSGHIGNKIAATFASTGSPAFFIHCAEACHGDLGMITKNDVVLVISYSGEIREMLDILPLIKRFNIPLVTLTGNANSTLAKQADANIDIGIIKEACPFNLAPTTSTTICLVLGDALAMTLLKARGFTQEDFALRHPGGALGRKLLLRIKDIMNTGSDIPKVLEGTSLIEALIEMSRKKLGMAAVVNNNDNVIGIFTDGDLRRTVDRGFDIYKTKIDVVMTKNFTVVDPDMLAVKALHLAESLKINGFPVVDADKKLIGALNLHNFLRAGIF